MARAVAFLKAHHPGVRLIGPNCPGVITPGRVQDRHHAGLYPQGGPRRRGQPIGNPDLRGGLAAHESGHRPEHLRRASAATRSTAPASSMLSTLFQADPDTDAVLMMGEIGGNAEEQAADFKAPGKFTKPLAAFIAGQTAPPGKRMGHAGAIISGGSGKASDKIAALEGAGIRVAKSPADMGSSLKAGAGKVKQRSRQTHQCGSTIPLEADRAILFGTART